jgi:predicted NBD/HSP70 family sugar kinase
LALAETGRRLGAVAGACVAVLNPQRIILGGGLGLAAFPYLVPAVMDELRRRVLPVCLEGLEVVPSRLPSSAVGAACLVFARRNLLPDPNPPPGAAHERA